MQKQRERKGEPRGCHPFLCCPATHTHSSPRARSRTHIHTRLTWRPPFALPRPCAGPGVAGGPPAAAARTSADERRRHLGRPLRPQPCSPHPPPARPPRCLLPSPCWPRTSAKPRPHAGHRAWAVAAAAARPTRIPTPPAALARPPPGPRPAARTGPTPTFLPTSATLSARCGRTSPPCLTGSWIVSVLFRKEERDCRSTQPRPARHQPHTDGPSWLIFLIPTPPPPLLISLSPLHSGSIYRDDVVFRDPRNCFKGLKNYKIIFWSLRFHGEEERKRRGEEEGEDEDGWWGLSFSLSLCL